MWTVPLVRRFCVWGFDLLLPSFQFFPFLFTNHVSRNEQRYTFQKMIKTSHMVLPDIQYKRTTPYPLPYYNVAKKSKGVTSYKLWKEVCQYTLFSLSLSSALLKFCAPEEGEKPWDGGWESARLSFLFHPPVWHSPRSSGSSPVSVWFGANFHFCNLEWILHASNILRDKVKCCSYRVGPQDLTPETERN